MNDAVEMIHARCFFALEKALTKSASKFHVKNMDNLSELSLRGRQMASVTSMLKEIDSWKVLIFDRPGQDVIAPLLNVKSLREAGVTLHLLINADREAVPQTPAVYFLQPTTENVNRIADDLKKRLYGEYYFNFTSPIGRDALESLASAAIEADAVNVVKRLFDRYVNFVSLEEQMFVLRHQNASAVSYGALNSVGVTDTQMDAMLDGVVDSLFAVFVTMGVVPVIRAPSGGNAAHEVAKRLDKKLRDNLRDARSSLFEQQIGFRRPLLVLLDRQFDLASTLHHTWTYQALAHDVLQYSLNRVTIPPTVESGSKARVCDLDGVNDAFWTTQKGSPFPLVAEKIQEELEDYRTKEDDIKRMKHEMGLDGDESNALSAMLTDNTQRLTSAVSNLPALLEKKRLIDMHTSLATAILEQIKLRKLDTFFELEEKLMSRGGAGQEHSKAVLEMIEDPEAGTPEDKMRLFLIYYLCSPQIADEEVDKFAGILESIGCDMASLKYLKRWKAVSRMSAVSSSEKQDYGGGGTKTVSMYSKLMTQASSFVMEGVKNLVVKKHNLPVTKIVEELMEIRQGPIQESYAYFDPKILRGGSGNNADLPRAKNPFQEAVVFMVGGGNYIEYQNLMDFATGRGSSANATSEGGLAPSASSVSLANGAMASMSSSMSLAFASVVQP